MTIDLQTLLMGEQASNLAAMARAHTNVMDLQQRVSLDKWAATDLLDAAAAKEVAKSGVATDLAGFRAGVQTPPTA
ncbi:hypothetical protein ACYFX5_15460 [Bremerella sp. T1]|uniref:hypothetical protein n=1 Tax=Bremerella sp. TYQ1 TaxID=3119568 RepID=UPI001CCCA0B5|nr:hypothetical protein [Bremerella volcania]UBM34454.1 hypothetical protein LA756_17410 [Bremerella volcania]